MTPTTLVSPPPPPADGNGALAVPASAGGSGLALATGALATGAQAQEAAVLAGAEQVATTTQDVAREIDSLQTGIDDIKASLYAGDYGLPLSPNTLGLAFGEDDGIPSPRPEPAT